MAVDCVKMRENEWNDYDRVKDACENYNLLPHITIFEMKSDDPGK
jgi:hypothetical protein